jgi:hypothetical protein
VGRKRKRAASESVMSTALQDYSLGSDPFGGNFRGQVKDLNLDARVLEWEMVRGLLRPYERD